MGVEFTTGGPNKYSLYMATDADYQSLYNLLRTDPVINTKRVLINHFGEWVPFTPSAGDPAELADRIAEGTIFIDYCGWPMYAAGSRPYFVDASRFTRFVRVIGKLPRDSFPYGEYLRFDPHNEKYRCLPQYQLPCKNGYIDAYPWARGLIVNVDITKRTWYVPPGSVVKTKTLDVPDWPTLLTIRCYSSFGLQHGKGWYFYAYRGRPWYSVEGVSPQTYAGYIKTALTGVTPPPTEPGPPPTEPGPPSGCDPGRCSQQITVRQGSQGPCVGLAQQLLAQAGYSPGPVDCVFGSQTNSAVRAFQQARGLAVDGIVGPQTWAALSGAAGDGGQQPEPVPPPPPPPPPVPWLLYAGIGATALLAMLAGYLLVRGPRPPEE